MNSIIFDLDQTLVNSDIAKEFRDKRMWSNVYSLIPNFKINPNMLNLLNQLIKNEVKLSIVTSSPRLYCEKVVRHFNIPIDIMIGYHDTSLRKPNPEPFFLAIKMMCADKNKCLTIGDGINDVLAAKRSQIKSIAYLEWSNEKDDVVRLNPDYLANDFDELYKVITSNVLRG